MSQILCDVMREWKESRINGRCQPVQPWHRTLAALAMSRSTTVAGLPGFACHCHAFSQALIAACSRSQGPRWYCWHGTTWHDCHPFLFDRRVALKLILLGSTWPVHETPSKQPIRANAPICPNMPQWPASAQHHLEETGPVATLRTWHRH